MANKDALGPTGQFPNGKIHPNDEGETRIAVGHKEGNVILEFGGPVTWIGFPPDRALELARLIMYHANKAAGGRTQ